MNKGKLQNMTRVLQAWMKANPQEDDEESEHAPRITKRVAHAPSSAYRSGSTISQTFFYAEDGTMKCTLCSTSGFCDKDELRQHINIHHTGTYHHTDTRAYVKL